MQVQEAITSIYLLLLLLTYLVIYVSIAVVVEDGVRGTGSGYNQVNAYSGGANGPMGNYHNLPNPVPAAQMVYDHVARAILGNWVGTEASLPTSV